MENIEAGQSEVKQQEVLYSDGDLKPILPPIKKKSSFKKFILSLLCCRKQEEEQQQQNNTSVLASNEAPSENNVANISDNDEKKNMIVYTSSVSAEKKKETIDYYFPELGKNKIENDNFFEESSNCVQNILEKNVASESTTINTTTGETTVSEEDLISFIDVKTELKESKTEESKEEKDEEKAKEEEEEERKEENEESLRTASDVSDNGLLLSRLSPIVEERESQRTTSSPASVCVCAYWTEPFRDNSTHYDFDDEGTLV